MRRILLFTICYSLFFLLPIDSARAQTTGSASSSLTLSVPNPQDGVSISATVNQNSSSTSSSGTGTTSGFATPGGGVFDLAAGDSLELLAQASTTVPGITNGSATSSFSAFSTIDLANNSGSAVEIVFGLLTDLEADSFGLTPFRTSSSNSGNSAPDNISNSVSSSVAFDNGLVEFDNDQNFSISLDDGQISSFDVFTDAFSTSFGVVPSGSNPDLAVPEPSSLTVIGFSGLLLALRRRRK